VLNWNAWEETRACIESLLEGTVHPRQIVVCDNGSMDDSVEHLSQWLQARELSFVVLSPQQALAESAPSADIVLVAIPNNLGYAGANNIGLRYAIERAGAQYVWILNGDTVAERTALERMLALAESDPLIGMVGAKLLRYDAPDTIQAAGGGYIVPVICHDTQLGAGKNAKCFDGTPIPLDHLIGASLLVRAQAARETGPIDESYFLYREETDWCIRMRRAGWRLYCCGTAVVWHRQAHSVGFKSPIHDYYAVRNMLHLVRKLYPRCLPTAFGYFALRSLLPKLARMEFRRLRAVLLALRDFLMGRKGRAAEHTDPVLLRSYLHSNAHDRSARPAKALAAILALLFVASAVGFMGFVIVRRRLVLPVGVAQVHEPAHRR
jgi:GT2 family glycosyltransferase